MKKIEISKLDAAKRQLKTAINLYFSYGDPVSIHTLASAAREILYDLNKKHSGMPIPVKTPCESGGSRHPVPE
jgi:hypothetical protein